MLNGGGGYTAPGVATETALTALTIIDDLYSGQFYGVVCPAAVNNDHEDLGLGGHRESLDRTEEFIGLNRLAQVTNVAQVIRPFGGVSHR